MLSKENIIARLKAVYDPEIPVNIYDLGLVYDIKINEGKVEIIMTLTTATCPAAVLISEEVKDLIQNVDGVSSVKVNVVFNPRWTRDKMSEEAKEFLGWY